MDLLLLLSAKNLDNPNMPVVPGKVDHADVALIANIDKPYEVVIAENRYPKGSVLDLVLSSETVKRKAKLGQY